MTPLADAEGHTPGPWRLARETVEDIPFGPTSMNVLCGPHGILTSVEGLSAADRALIAMAPALLAEVQAARALADAANDGTFTEEMQDAYWAAREATDGGTDGWA